MSNEARDEVARRLRGVSKDGAMIKMTLKELVDLSEELEDAHLSIARVLHRVRDILRSSTKQSTGDVGGP